MPTDEREKSGERGGSQKAVIIELRRDIERLEGQLAEADEVIGNLRWSVGKLEGEVRILVSHYDRAATANAAEALARVEVRKTQELEAIKDGSLTRDYRRQLILKAAATITGLGAIIAAALARQC